MPTRKLTLFAESKNERRNALYVQQYGKKYTSRAEVTSNNKKIKPVALMIVDLKASGRQTVSH